MLEKELSPITIGGDDFKVLRDNGALYIDKTNFIMDLIKDTAVVTLVSRPRRFGKTLNLSMMRYFFDIRVDYSYLFNGLNIKEFDKYNEYVNKYPVISLSLKECKQDSYDDFLKELKDIVATVYFEYKYILDKDLYSVADKNYFNDILSLSADISAYKKCLLILSRMLYQYYEKEVYIFLDEYDAPIQAGWLNDYYDEIVLFMQAFMGSAFKGNTALKQGLITGVTRVSGADLFSSFNNLSVCSVIETKYSQYFGFTKEEVISMLDKYNLSDQYNAIKEMYDGYLFGKTNIYNPWSILSYLNDTEHTIKPYWVNTGGTDIVKRVIEESDIGIKQQFDNLIITKSIVDVVISENLSLNNMNDNDIWSLLVYAGYLTPIEFIDSSYYVEGSRGITLRVPNMEVGYNLKVIISNWFKEKIGSKSSLSIAVKECDMASFKKEFERLVITSFSYYDVTETQDEYFYHAFVLGLMASSSFKIESNKEVGYGRPDIIASNEEYCYIFELKKCENRSFDKTIKQAFKQIEEKKYNINYQDKKIIKIAIAFDKKKCKVEYRGENILI